jgi:two-component system, NtrC family, sensor histidine kinase HydH
MTGVDPSPAERQQAEPRDPSDLNPPERRRWTRYVRGEDIAWVLLFAALAIFGPERTPIAISLLACLAIFQVLEPKIPLFASERGVLIGIAIKLVLAYVLIGFTDAIRSAYYPVLLLPVVSAATSLGVWGTASVITLACAAFASFLLFLPVFHVELMPGEAEVLFLRIAWLPVVGVLTHQLAEANRIRAKNYQALAEQLAEANSSLQEAEDAVRRADRLAALGQLTAGLAHELRNPLSTIKNSAEMLARSVPSDNPIAREVAGYISSEVDRTNSLITRFLEFARPLRLRLELTDVTAILDRAIFQVEQHTPPFEVTFYSNYSPDIRPFLLDGELMERVFYNLLLNAAQASPPHSAVTAKTREAEGEIEIAIIDCGSGIQPKDLEDIFNPFFTTKSAGVGLGLAIVSKIVDEHGGKILVDSQPEQGTVFRVVLPLRYKKA